ncbi:MAG: GIY-YIG nuclease family protein [Candidatus Omnitrophota bacterium]|nr:GIY-YIG nuclease family protein [Candidatus Omnitrophota bacterium]
MSWYVYIIECCDKTLYTGVTNNLSRRINDHNKGNGCRYTKFRWPVKLVHFEGHFTKSEAQRREAYIKSLTRDKKLQLCER